MKAQYKVALAMLGSAALGALAVQGLHAQAKPPIYSIVEIDITNPEAYTKDYVPMVQPLLKAAGARFLAAGKPTPFEGEPPKSRVVVQQWDSMEKIQAWRNSAAFKDSRKIGDKYAKFRSFTVEGVSQ
jgi:uncharacterized protein (DUF1330 family)